MARAHPELTRFGVLTVALLSFAVGGPAATAQDRPYQHGLYFELQPDNFGFGTALGYRVRTTRGSQFGIELSSAYDDTVFIAGREGEDANAFSTRLTSLTPVWEESSLAFAFRGEAGFRRTWGAQAAGTDDGTAVVPLEDTSSWAVELEVGLLGYMNMHPKAILRMGVLVPLSFEVSPTTEFDLFGALLLVGVQGRVGHRWWLYGDFETGGVGGFQGDGAKVVLRGIIGVRVAIGKEPESWEVF